MYHPLKWLSDCSSQFDLSLVFNTPQERHTNRNLIRQTGRFPTSWTVAGQPIRSAKRSLQCKYSTCYFVTVLKKNDAGKECTALSFLLLWVASLREKQPRPSSQRWQNTPFSRSQLSEYYLTEHNCVACDVCHSLQNWQCSYILCPHNCNKMSTPDIFYYTVL